MRARPAVGQTKNRLPCALLTTAAPTAACGNPQLICPSGLFSTVWPSDLYNTQSACHRLQKISAWPGKILVLSSLPPTPKHGLQGVASTYSLVLSSTLITCFLQICWFKKKIILSFLFTVPQGIAGPLHPLFPLPGMYLFPPFVLSAATSPSDQLKLLSRPL